MVGGGRRGRGGGGVEDEGGLSGCSENIVSSSLGNDQSCL